MPQYTEVHALLINWEEDDLGTITELEDLKSQFETQFHFTSEIWRIPSRLAEDSLERKIGDVKAQHGTEANLLIVYYGGHGKADKNGRSIWKAYVIFSHLRHLFADIEAK